MWSKKLYQLSVEMSVEMNMTKSSRNKMDGLANKLYGEAESRFKSPLWRAVSLLLSRKPSQRHSISSKLHT
jgi:hypothetical protein